MTTNKKTFTVFRAISSEATIEATSLQEAQDIACDLAEEDFTQTDAQEYVEETS